MHDVRKPYLNNERNGGANEASINEYTEHEQHEHKQGSMSLKPLPLTKLLLRSRDRRNLSFTSGAGTDPARMIRLQIAPGA